jgi:hypothetical protein
VPPDCFQVIGEARRLESGRVVHQRGAAGAALIVEEERMTPGRERIQLVPEIIEAQSRAAVDDHQGIAPRADQAVEEPDAVASVDVAFGAFSLGGERR